MFQFKNNIYMVVSVLGKNDPMCCPSKIELLKLNVYKKQGKFYLAIKQVNKIE